MKDACDTEALSYVPRWGSSTRMGESDATEHDFDYCYQGQASEGMDSELPVFSDDSNKLLHAETKSLQKKLVVNENSLKDESSRLDAMTNHIESVQAEIEHTNNFLAAKFKEIHAEKHLSTISLRERERIQQEIQRYSASLKVEKERLKAAKGKTVKVASDLEKFKASMNWNQEELEQWATAAAQKEDDNFALQRYVHADEDRVKELVMILESLTFAAAQKRSELDNEITETHARQVELDRTAQIFKLRHAERNRLVTEWKSTVESMKQRDEDIEKISRDFAKQSALKDAKLEELKITRVHVQLAENSNDELRREVDEKARLNQSKRHEHASKSVVHQSFADELEIIEYKSKACLRSLLTKKRELQVATHDLDEKKLQLNNNYKRCEAIKQFLKDVKKVTAGKEIDAKMMETFASENSRQLAESEKYVEKLKHLIFKESQLLNELRNEEKGIMAEIQSAQSMVKIMTAKVHSAERDKFRQQELLYDSEYQLQIMERKVARGLGERSFEETQLLQSHINELEENLTKASNKRNEIAQRSRRLASELKGWARQTEQRFQDEKDLQTAIDEIELELSSLETQKKSQIALKEELMLSGDILQLDFRRLRDKLAAGSEEVFNLELQLQQLEEAMREIKVELLAQTEISGAQARAVEEDRHKAAVELGKRKIVLEKLQSKYETIVKFSDQESTDAESGTRSQVCSLIAAAQKREELLREGDELDKKIQLKESELKAMKRTLEHIQGMNSEYRITLSKGDMKSECIKELRELEDTVVFAREKLVTQRESLHEAKMEHARVSSLLLSFQHDAVSNNVLALSKAASPAE